MVITESFCIEENFSPFINAVTWVGYTYEWVHVQIPYVSPSSIKWHEELPINHYDEMLPFQEIWEVSACNIRLYLYIGTNLHHGLYEIQYARMAISADE